MRITNRVNDHHQKVSDFSTKFNQKLDQSIEIMKSDDKRALKCVNVTGHLYGIDHIEFTKDSGSKLFQKTNLAYTQSALDEENKKIEELINDFSLDLQDVTDEDDFNSVRESINNLTVTVEKLKTLFNSVLAGYTLVDKLIEHGNKVSFLEESYKRLEKNLEKVQALQKQAEGTETQRKNLAKELFAEIKGQIDTIDKEEEKQKLKKFMNPDLNTADIDRSIVIINNEKFDNSSGKDELLKLKLKSLFYFCGQNESVRDVLIRTFHQGIAFPLTEIITNNFLPLNMAAGGSDTNKSNTYTFNKVPMADYLIITFQTKFPIIDCQTQKVLQSIKGTIQATMDISDLDNIGYCVNELINIQKELDKVKAEFDKLKNPELQEIMKIDKDAKKQEAELRESFKDLNNNKELENSLKAQNDLYSNLKARFTKALDQIENDYKKALDPIQKKLNNLETSLTNSFSNMDLKYSWEMVQE